MVGPNGTVAGGSDPNAELSRKGLLGRAAVLAGAAVAVGFPGSARAKPPSRDGVRWNAAEGRFDSAFVTTSPVSAAENTIQPIADVPALTLKGPTGVVAPTMEEFTDQNDVVFARFVLPTNPLPAPPAAAGPTGRLDFPAMGNGHGPVGVVSWRSLFDSTASPGVSLAYNYLGGGGVVVSGEPGASWAIEPDYEYAPGQRIIELYNECLWEPGLFYRPFYTYFRRSGTNRETRFGDQMELEANLFRFFTPVGDTTQDLAKIGKNHFEILPADSSQGTHFTLRAAEGRVCQFWMYPDGSPNPGFMLSADTMMDFPLYIGNPAVLAQKWYKQGAGSCVAMGLNDVGAALTVSGNALSGPYGIVVARQGASTTGALFSAQNDSGTPHWEIDVNGNEVFAEGKAIIVGTGAGTRIGTATDQKLGFFDATPVVQRPSHGPQTAGSGYGLRERNMLNDVYSGLRALGLLA